MSASILQENLCLVQVFVAQCFYIMSCLAVFICGKRVSVTTPFVCIDAQQQSQNGGEVVNEVPLAIPVQDTNNHTLVDDLHFSSGKNLPSTPLSVLELETKRTIASFNDTGELPVTIQQQDSQPEHVLPSVSGLLYVVKLNTIFLCYAGCHCKCCTRVQWSK